MIKLKPTEIFSEYEKAVNVNQELGLYEKVQQNERFFIGDQWHGVNAPKDLDKPVFNILKRVIAYFISTIVSDDVSARVTPFGLSGSQSSDSFMQVISNQIDEIIESAKVKGKNRDAIRNAAVDGDACFYIRFDETIETGQDISGGIDVEVLDNTNILFGNPQLQDLQRQPYILVMLRQTIASIREEAKSNGILQADIDSIIPDENEQLEGEIKETDKVTVLVKFFKQKNAEGKTTVHMIKTTRTTVIKKEVDLDYRLYPLAYFSWDKIKNSYHGQAAITGLIPNQIFINKLFAMSMEHVKSMAFPKVIYNSQMIARWDNRVGAAIAASGDISQAVATGFKAPDMSGQVMLMIEKAIQYTRDTMGASDAALGNIKPDNTSAIIAVQKSSSMPLELQKMDFYQFVEDYIRIFIDIMRVDYGVRLLEIADENGEASVQEVDFSQLDTLHLKLDVEVGASTYWSELMQVQTIDNLFAKGIISDAVLYLESIPSGYIPNKQKIIEHLKLKQMEQEQMAAMAQMGQIGQEMPPQEVTQNEMQTMQY